MKSGYNSFTTFRDTSIHVHYKFLLHNLHIPHGTRTHARRVRPLPLGKHAVLQLLRTLWSAIDASCNARFGCGLACPVRHVGAATGELQDRKKSCARGEPMWSLRCCPSLYIHPCNPSIEGAGLEVAHLPKHAMRWKYGVDEGCGMSTCIYILVVRVIPIRFFRGSCEDSSVSDYQL